MEGKGGPYTATLKQYQAKANYFACACLQKNDGYNAYMTPGTSQFTNRVLTGEFKLKTCRLILTEINERSYFFIVMNQAV